MNEDVFVNEFISTGMKDYFETKVSSFEAHIVECLCDVYEEVKVRAIYESHSEIEFSKMLNTYGLSSTVHDNFLRDTNRFTKFKKEKENNPTLKSDIASKVEVSVLTMFLYKCLLIEPTLEEISHFENNLLNNFEMIKWHFNSSIDPNKTRDVWLKKKRMLSDNVDLIEIKPNYLDEFTYQKFGTSLEEVKKMDYRMVSELNKYILDKEAADRLEVDGNVKKKKDYKNWLFNTPLTSGSGFTDALLIASIIAAEMAVGIIYLFLHM